MGPLLTPSQQEAIKNKHNNSVLLLEGDAFVTMRTTPNPTPEESVMFVCVVCVCEGGLCVIFLLLYCY